MGKDKDIKEALKRATREELAKALLDNWLYEWDGYLDGITGEDLVKDYKEFGWLQVAVILKRLLK